MKVLIVKTTSLGDIIHLLPALTDAQSVYPDIRFDWVVESSFKEVPRWHPAVDRIIPVQMRQWRKSPFSKATRQAYAEYKRILREREYDLIIDAQGLMKSAFLARKARGRRFGPDFRSAWEPLASLTYHRRVKVDPKQHAVVRMRSLIAGCLSYLCPTTTPDYGIKTTLLSDNKKAINEKTIVFIQGTTWITKEWPVVYWQQLLNHVASAGFKVLIPWGNDREHQRAKEIAGINAKAEVLPKLSLLEVAGVLANAQGAVSVDTGIGHLAAALALPTVSLYGPTDPLATGALGANQVHLKSNFACSPCLRERCEYKGERPVEPACFSAVSPDTVWHHLQGLLKERPEC